MKTYYGNGIVFTAEDASTLKSAFAVEDGRFVWVGETEEIPGDYVDLKGKFVTPGFIDNHMHPILGARMMKLTALMPPKVRSIEDVVRELSEVAKVTPEGEFIRGWGWDEVQFKEKRYLNRHDLDRISAKHPIICTRSCFHNISLNTYALEKFGITKDTEEIPGGKIYREEDGTPDGYLQEEASRLVLFNDDTPKEGEDPDIEALVAFSKRLARHGITSVSDIAAVSAPENYMAKYKEAQKRGFAQRVSFYYLMTDILKNKLDLKRPDNEEEKLRVAGVKMVTDGSMSAHSAYLKEPYPGTEERGFPVNTMEELVEAGEYARAHGLQASIHAMGDESIERCLDAYKGWEPWLGDIPSIRIEHCTITDDATIDRIAEQKVAASLQTIFAYAEYASYENNLDKARFDLCYRMKSLREKCPYISLSSDCPATAWGEAEDIRVGIKSAVRRLAPGEKEYNRSEEISVGEALLCYTRDAAIINFMPFTGMIKEGYMADFTISDRNILEADFTSEEAFQVLATYVGGEMIYEK